jgi:TonB family protein
MSAEEKSMRAITKVSTKASLLLISLAFTAVAAHSQSANDASAPTRDTSNGAAMVPPRVVYAPRIVVPALDLGNTIPADPKVVLNVDLDQTGRPQNVEVVGALNPAVDARVMDTVQQFRWQPALVNDEPVPTETRLVVEVKPAGSPAL